MSTFSPNEIETQDLLSDSLPPLEPTRRETFSKTATAARISGAYHEAAGFMKRKLGKLSADFELEDAGRNQQLLGKVHRLVGALRGVRNAALDKLKRTRVQSVALCREHGGRLLDGVSDFVDEVRKSLLE